MNQPVFGSVCLKLISLMTFNFLTLFVFCVLDLWVLPPALSVQVQRVSLGRGQKTMSPRRRPKQTVSVWSNYKSTRWATTPTQQSKTTKLSSKTSGPKTDVCCPTWRIRYTSSTVPNSATSSVLLTFSQCTVSRRGWSTGGRACDTRAGPSQPSVHSPTASGYVTGSGITPSRAWMDC